MSNFVFSVDLPTMEKYFGAKEVVPHPEFMDINSFPSLKNITQIPLPIVASRSPLDKLIPGFEKMDYRK